MSQGQSQDFSVFVLAQIRGDLEAMKEMAVGALALLDALRDLQASAEAEKAKDK